MKALARSRKPASGSPSLPSSRVPGVQPARFIFPLPLRPACESEPGYFDNISRDMQHNDAVRKSMTKRIIIKRSCLQMIFLEDKKIMMKVINQKKKMIFLTKMKTIQ